MYQFLIQGDFHDYPDQATIDPQLRLEEKQKFWLALKEESQKLEIAAEKL